MPNIKLVIEYDGSTFSGWQWQANAVSVQSELHAALETVLREKIKHVQSAGRTDAGVHACGQVVNFFVDAQPDLMKLRLAVSSLLRGRVSVLDACVVPDSFNALSSAKSKCYRYRILHRPMPEALERGRAWRISYPLDIEVLRREAACLVGTHDFSSFRSIGCSARSTIKRIDSVTIDVVRRSPIFTDELIEISIVGGGFLRNMVRIIVGTLVNLAAQQSIGRESSGQEKLTPANSRNSSMQEILQSRSRAASGVTAPAHGLYMMYVNY